MAEQELKDFFDRQGIVASVNHYDVDSRVIYYAVVGQDHLPALLFIHGAPANMTIYKEFFKDEELLSRFTIYAVDRPGFGVTGGNPEPSIYKQAQIIAPLAERVQRVHQPLIIVAGSYGASIACRIVMDIPGLVQGLVLLSPSLGPGLEKKYWLAPLTEKTILGKLVPKEIYAASVEKNRHEQELKKMLPLWYRIDIPVVYLQSEKDEVVFASNADFAKKMLTQTPYLKIHLFSGSKHTINSKFHSQISNKIFELSGMLN